MEKEQIHCSYTEEQRKAHEKQFLENKPSDCVDSIDNQANVKIGDMVVVRNAYGVLVGPYKVLGFCMWQNEPCMFLDWDCWWYPKEISYLHEIV